MLWSYLCWFVKKKANLTVCLFICLSDSLLAFCLYVDVCQLVGRSVAPSGPPPICLFVSLCIYLFIESGERKIHSLSVSHLLHFKRNSALKRKKKGFLLDLLNLTNIFVTHHWAIKTPCKARKADTRLYWTCCSIHKEAWDTWTVL